MGLDEQRSTALTLKGLNNFPGMLRVVLWIRTDQRDRFITQLARDPYGTLGWLNAICPATWMRRHPARFSQCHQLAFLCLHHSHFMPVFGGTKEVPTR